MKMKLAGKLLACAAALVLLTGCPEFWDRTQPMEAAKPKVPDPPVVAVAPEPPAIPVGLPRSVPARLKLDDCPQGTHGFENPAQHYRLCSLRGWGFIDFESRAPMTTIGALHLYHLRLADSTMFPWRAGIDSPRDAVEGRGGVIVTIHDAEKDVEGTCPPRRRRLVDGAPARWCIDTFEWDGEASRSDPDGRFRSLQVAIRLSREPVKQYPGSIGRPRFLWVSALLRTRDWERLKPTLWTLIDSIEMY